MTVVRINGEVHHICTSDEETKIVHAESGRVVFQHHDPTYSLHVLEGLLSYQ
jgi:hypothetical protein